jgi:DNA-directed RNA polymerase subunit RPC12/RpoP
LSTAIAQASRVAHNQIAERWSFIVRCMACGAEMVLINTAEDLTKPILGFKRETYMCSACGDTERRTAFNKQAREKREAEIATVLNQPHIASIEKVDDQPHHFLKRVLAKIRWQ